jgi:hypothetical protein
MKFSGTVSSAKMSGFPTFRKLLTPDYGYSDSLRNVGNIFHFDTTFREHFVAFEEYYLLGYNAVQSVESRPTFRRNLSSPSSGSKNKPIKKPVWKQVASRPQLRTTQNYIPEDRTLRNQCCENLKCFIPLIHRESFKSFLILFFKMRNK